MSYVEQLVGDGRLDGVGVGEVVCTIDECGVVSVTVPVGVTTNLFLQAGDGWDRVLWTCPSGRTHEWLWRVGSTPLELDALLDGQGFERTTLFGARLAAVELVANGRTLATEGRLRSSVLRRFRVRLRVRQQPAR